MNSEENNNNESPFLSSLEKKESFKAPDGYFGSLPSKIQDRITEVTASKSHTIFSLSTWKWVAAGALILSAGFYFFPKLATKPAIVATTSVNDNLTDDELTDELADEMDSNTLETEVKSAESVNSNDAINYLIENHIDITLINEK